jgi:hypothetical protein
LKRLDSYFSCIQSPKSFRGLDELSGRLSSGEETIELSGANGRKDLRTPKLIDGFG